MFNFSIINPPKSFIIKEKIIKEILLELENIENNTFHGTLNLIFLEDKEIQKLNNQYRSIDKSTDVLSFHYFDDFSGISKSETAGEIIFSESKIISQGKQYKLGSELEFYKLFIHSCFHLLGYDHEKDNEYIVMKEKENTLWEKIFI